MADDVTLSVGMVDNTAAGSKSVSNNVKKMTGDVKKSNEDFKKFAAGVGMFTAGIGTFAAVFTKAMQFGKEGAQLEYARSKFDKLSDSIGSTSDAMLGKLRMATRGLRTDAELVGAAGDLMALGLAKTEDQVVRLTRVSGALNMDMNQLVLTLANKTTMRFDQLGVSVDGFKEKVDELKKSGMSAEDAFTEAFLRQAEEQVEKVGEAADSSIASFQRLEVAAKTLGDNIKIGLVPFLASAADAMNLLITKEQTLIDVFNEHAENVRDTTFGYDAYISEITRAAKVMGYNVIVHDGMVHVLNGVGVGAQDVTDKFNILNQAEYEAARYAYDAESANKLLEGSLDGVADKAAEASQEIMDAANAMRSDLVDATKAVRDAQQDWMEGAGGDVADALKDAGLKGDDYRTALGLIDQAYGTGLGIQQDYKDDVADLVKNYKDGKLSGDEFKTALGKMKDEYMPLNEQVREANDQLWYLQLKWQWFQEHNQVDMYFNVHQSGNIPGSGSNTSKTSPGANAGSGGPGTGEKGETRGLAAGGSFIVPSRYTNDSYPLGNGIYASAGERVTVTPAGQGVGLTIMQLYVTLPSVTNAQQFARELGKMAASKMASGAAASGGL